MRINTQEVPIIYFFHSTSQLSASKRACVRLQDKRNASCLIQKCSVQFGMKSTSDVKNILSQMLHGKNSNNNKQTNKHHLREKKERKKENIKSNLSGTQALNWKSNPSSLTLAGGKMEKISLKKRQHYWLIDRH